MVSALVSGRGVVVRVLVGDIVLCSRARHFTLTVPLSAYLVFKLVPPNLLLGGNLVTSIASRSELKYFYIDASSTETGISSGLMGHFTICTFYILP